MNKKSYQKPSVAPDAGAQSLINYPLMSLESGSILGNVGARLLHKKKNA